MMGKEHTKNVKLFYSFSLESKVPEDHILRKLSSVLNLDFLYDLVSDRYGYKRARWRTLWRVKIEQLLIATLQNLIKIAKNGSINEFFLKSEL